MKSIRKLLAACCRKLATKLMTWAGKLDGVTEAFCFHNGDLARTYEELTGKRPCQCNECRDPADGWWNPKRCSSYAPLGGDADCEIVSLDGPE